jgi:F-box domain
MPSIPVDVLREILEHVDKNDLATLCRVNKICCSCSQGVLYRAIHTDSNLVIRTLAQSTDLARRVRSFNIPRDGPGLGTALGNMSSLRRLNIRRITDTSILNGCTFKLDTIMCDPRNSQALKQFLINQPSLTNITLYANPEPPPLSMRGLPNLTRVAAEHSWLRILIPGRPVTDVDMLEFWPMHTIDLSYFALSTAPINSLKIRYDYIYPTPESHLVSIFPSIVDLVLVAYQWNLRVRRRLTVIGVLLKKSTIIDHIGP